ncbi:MAG: hypothetical protein QXU88_00780 [Candidatus Woesearchaeota archaeon]
MVFISSFGVAEALWLAFMALIGTLLLMLTAKVFKLNASFEQALPVSILSFAIVWVAALLFSQLDLLGVVLSWFTSVVSSILLVKWRYKLGLGWSAAVWLVWAMLSFVVGFALGLIAPIFFPKSFLVQPL